MKKLLLMISCLLLLNSAAADNPCQGMLGPYGPVTCTAGTTEFVTANGPVTMKNTIVKNSTKINGSLAADRVIFNNLTINGQVNLIHSIVKGGTIVNGYLNAKETIFMSDLTLAVNNLALHNCTTSNIVINSNDGDGVVSPQIIRLTGKTEVNGMITFKQKDGIVYVGPQVKIKGAILGGKIILQHENKQITNSKSTAAPASI